MEKIWITSDWHFNHNKSFLYEPRGFPNIEDMNNAIIDKHNSLVSLNDEVYVLGDLCLGGSENNKNNKILLEQLNGNIHVIIGNHCTPNRVEMYKTCNNIKEIIGYAGMLIYKKYHFYLSHYPTLTSNLDLDKPLKARIINLCGHSHTQNRWNDWDKGLIYHCEMEAHNCYPVLLDDIINQVKNKIEPESKPEPQQLNTLARCYKCVYSWPLCGNNFENCKSYKRDPPDGGYYG